MEEALSDLIVLILKEFSELTRGLESQIFGCLDISLHQAINKNGALLQMRIRAILDDVLERPLEQSLGLRGTFEEELEDGDEQGALELAVTVALLLLLCQLLQDVRRVLDLLAKLSKDPDK